MDKQQKKEIYKEIGIAFLVWGLFVVAVLFASATEEFTYAMF